jgi:hypothetical protein
MLSLTMSLDLSSGVGSSADTPGGPRLFSGLLFYDRSGDSEQVEVFYEADLNHAIRELDLQELGDEE